jgi:hypothetical protein
MENIFPRVRSIFHMPGPNTAARPQRPIWEASMSTRTLPLQPWQLSPPRTIVSAIASAVALLKTWRFSALLMHGAVRCEKRSSPPGASGTRRTTPGDGRCHCWIRASHHRQSVIRSLLQRDGWPRAVPLFPVLREQSLHSIQPIAYLDQDVMIGQPQSHTDLFEVEPLAV